MSQLCSRTSTPWLRRRLAAAMVALLLVVSAAVTLAAQEPHADREQLTHRHLSTPGFEPPTRVWSGSRTVENLWTDLTGPAGERFLQSLMPTQSGVLWIALLVALMVAFDFSRLTNPRNVELLGLLAIGFLLFDVMRFFEFLRDPTYFRLMDWVFTGIVAVSLAMFGVALWRMRRPHATAWRPNLPRRALMTLALLLLAGNVAIGLIKPPDDAGFYSNVGGQRVRESGRFPYGDPLFTVTPVATYTPIFFFAHIPYQMLLDPEPVNRGTFDKTAFDAGEPYYLPPLLASQLATVTFHLLGVIALVFIARRMAGPEVAWGVAALYCGSAYVMGVGGEHEAINGMTFISHIAPAAMSLLAFAALGWPLLAGALLATAVATLYYPMFFIPAWLGYYWHDRKAAVRFVAGLALATIVIGGPVLLRSQASDERGLIGTILYDTMGHQQDPDAYGSSPFGFWGLRGGVRAWLQTPLVSGQYNTTPLFLLFGMFVVGTFFLARGSTLGQLALLTGALAIGAQMWKIHGTGVYVTWWYPFLLLGLLAGRARTDVPPASRVAPSRVPETGEGLA